MALGIGVLAWFPSVIGVFLIIGGICLKVYGKKLREEVEMAEHRAKYEEEAKMKAAAQKSAAEKAEKEKREDRRYFASVVSPPRISCEEVFDDEDIPAGD